MKRISFTVVVEFSSDIEENEIGVVANNLLDGIVRQMEVDTISPEDSNAHTKSIEISKDGLIICDFKL